jgi:hypothetical protein
VARLLADENFPLPVVEALRRRGHDVVTLDDRGQAHQATADRTVLQIAIAESRAIATLNRRHFLRLHTETPLHAGMVVCTFDPDFENQAQRIDEALRASGELKGQVLRVNR